VPYDISNIHDRLLDVKRLDLTDIKYYVDYEAKITLQRIASGEIYTIQLNEVINTKQVIHELYNNICSLTDTVDNRYFHEKMHEIFIIVFSMSKDNFWIIYNKNNIHGCRKHFGTRLFPEEVTVRAGAVAGAGAGAVTREDEDPPMTGGSRYKQLYNKYKNKYLLLKNK
jgi:hypothetical protein